MKDASTDKPVLATDAALAADSSDGNAQDGEASPQARDKRPIVIGRREHTAEPDKSNIEQWREAYKNNPLIRVPVQNFAADVLEPGLSVTLELGDDADEEAVPSVPDDHYAEQYRGLDLDTALEQWLANSYIDGWDFDASATDLLEAIVKDRRGRRGTGLVEHSWDDPTKRERLLALRPIKTETVTAYIREGKAIALRPDDNANEFESVAVDDLGDDSRETAPKTPAGKTATIAQFDDVFGASERDEIPFALDDITVSPYDADTGALFGRPDTATVAERADAVKEKLAHIDQAILNTAFANIIAKVDTDDRELATKIRDDLSVNSPDTVSGTNVPVEITELDGSVPDAVDTIQQEIEFVLAAMPTPLYRVGFAGDINRDVTDVQQEDYRDEVKRERRRLEADFQGALEQKAREFLHGSAQADAELDVTPRLRIRPEEAASPLRDEEFDPEAFATLMNGLATAAGPKGGADTIVPQDEIVDTFLDMDPDDVLGGDGADEAELDESDPRVQQAFAEFTDVDAALATGADRHAYGPAMNTDDAFYRLDPDEAYCAVEGDVFGQFDDVDTDDNDRRLCPYCGDQLQDTDAALADGQSGVTFTNVGGDPFHDQATLEAFLDELADVAEGPVRIGDTEWPAEDYSIHDHPVTAVGLSEAAAESIWADYSDEARALCGPKPRAALSADDWTPELHPRDEEGKFTEAGGAVSGLIKGAYETFSDESDRQTVSNLTQAWAGWPTDSDTAPLWKAAEQATGNRNDPTDITDTPMLQNQASPETVQTAADYQDHVSDVLGEVAEGDTITAHRFLHGEAAERLRNGESLPPRTLASWTTDENTIGQVIDEAGFDAEGNPIEAEDAVVVTMEVPIENVMDHHAINPELNNAGQNEAIIGLPESDDLADGTVREATEVTGGD
ncbi:hypothetical protein SAMN05216388_101765 [Halorientalis persicus]|uniref:Uncharacterized protein n=1 Tax=Halorientalis persicus TaxID=1367881 RepID=A0A1H8RXC2_9EURY|nr:hypothetical protein [Halorientalis persicus]SEO70854.1 hypothetical protein SAMN05216388_101765 [Halorientalis persicus]